MHFLLPILAEAPATPPAGNPLAQFLPLIFIVVIFYFLLIRPQQKQRKQHQELMSSLKTGDQVISSSGIHGKIANVKDTTVTLKVADNVKIEMSRDSITTVLAADA